MINSRSDLVPAKDNFLPVITFPLNATIFASLCDRVKCVCDSHAPTEGEILTLSGSGEGEA